MNGGVATALGGTGHAIGLRAVGHSYGAMRALSSIHLDIAPRELIALLGPSGCGKTTLLKIIAGFVEPTDGHVVVDGEDITKMPPALRKVGIVFQNYALFPHMTVRRNVGYGLRARRTAAAEVEARVGEMLALVKMNQLADRYPGELSGGQQQRVALARALAVQPRIMLLDEPFSALDRGLRLDMQLEVKSLLNGYGVTTILVTHDQEEALSMADRIVVLREGMIEQVGTASDLYDRPRTLFVNRFLGQTNLLGGRVEAEREGTLVLDLDCGARMEVPCEQRLAPRTRVYFSVRPENLLPGAPDPAAIPATVSVNVPLGPIDVTELRSKCGVPVKMARPHRTQSMTIPTGAHVHLHVESLSSCSVFETEGSDGAAMTSTPTPGAST